MPPPKPNPSTVEQLTHAIRLAYTGETAGEWLDNLIREAGYIHPETGYQQKDLIELVPNLTRATLRNWESDGLPAVKRGRSKYYPIAGFIGFLYGRFVRSGRLSGDDELNRHKARYVKSKADLSELAYLRETGQLIDRAEAEALLIAAISQAQAALLGLPGTLAPQLEHQPAATVRKTLDKHLRWLCNEMAHGRVPMPEALKRDLATLWRKHDLA